MRKKKLISILAIACFVSVLYTGCSSNSSNSGKKESKAVIVTEKEENKEEKNNNNVEEEISTETKEGEFEGIPDLDVSAIWTNTFGNEDGLLSKKIEATEKYYSKQKELIKNFDSTIYSYASDVTDFSHTSDMTQYRLSYSFGRPYVELNEYPEGDSLNSISSDITFFEEETKAYQEYVSIDFRVEPGREIKLLDRDKKIILSLLPEVDISEIEKSVNELNEHLKISSEYKEIELERDYGNSLMVDCLGVDEYSDNNSISITYYKTTYFK